MKRHLWLSVILALPLSLQAADPTTPITWKKTIVDRKFRSEGVGVADVNKDGKMDIIVGDVWYEAPDWKMHEIRKVGDYGDGAGRYSDSFACFPGDFNNDGWVDVIVIPFPGKECYWYENPKGEPGHWKAHMLARSACNETPQYADLFGDGRQVLIMGSQPEGKETEGEMAWFSPGKDPTKLWDMYSISGPSRPGHEVPGTRRFSHGMGVTDMNGDGRLDVVCTGGWWEQPAERSDKPWTFHPARIGEDCADMFAYDVDGDGMMDVLSSSAHRYGVWWHKQKAGKDGKAEFETRNILRGLVSQTHAMHFVDINGDGLKDIVTGKRWWAHGPRGDEDPNVPPDLYWLEAKRGPDKMTTFQVHRIDGFSGIGTQFAVADINGDKLPDVIVSNKKGVYVLEQVRGSPAAEQQSKR